MNLSDRQPNAAYFQGIFLLTSLLCFTESTLLEMVEAIAEQDNASDTMGTSVCIFTTVNSSLDTIAPQLVPSLIQKYPTTFMTMDSYVYMRRLKLATLVLLDLTAYHREFPFKFIQRRLDQHPCCKKSAKFVILMGGMSFNLKETALKYLEKFSILNFVLIPVVNASSFFTVYTWNQYTRQEHYFRSTDRPVTKFFPDKLRNLNGYRFKMIGLTDYPYMLFGWNKGAMGLVANFVRLVIRDRCNGTATFTDDVSLQSVSDGNFNLENDRFFYTNRIYFWEESAIVLVCPKRSVRDFLSHLLKPFSIGIWLVLGGVLAVCRVLKHLFPHIFRHDLIVLTFFGGGGVEYQQPFACRSVTLILAVLIFFLSEAYNAKIISLMSFAKFYEQPQTLEDIQRSDLRILSTRAGSDFLGPISKNFLSYRATLRVTRRLGDQVYQHYCSAMFKGNAWVAVAEQMKEDLGSLYIVEEPLLTDKLLMQLSQHSPFFELFERMFGLLNECGMWAYNLERANVLMFTSSQISMQARFQEVIFYFEDLTCIWILIMVGWLISTVCFVGEIAGEAWKERKRRRVVRTFQKVRKYRMVKAWFNSE